MSAPNSIAEGTPTACVPLTDAELNMTPAEWAEAFMEDPSCIRTYLLAAIERGQKTRDQAWALALGLSHFDAYDGLHFDYCIECAPLRMLLASAASAAQPPSAIPAAPPQEKSP